jgi:hypothetical protein
VVETAMGLHNLESESLIDIFNAFASEHQKSQAHGWLDHVLSSYGSIPNAPFSTEAELASHMLSGLRGIYFNYFHRGAKKKAELLNKIIQKNAGQRLAIFIELVDSPSMDDTLARYTVWKGTLFETRLEQIVVCWHPDKDYKPVGAVRVYRTAYSELGRRRRRRQTRENA